MTSHPHPQANGLQAYFASLFLFFLLQQHGPKYGLEVSWVYHHMGELLSAMNVFSLAFCAFLLVKGLTRPSTTDSGSSGNWVIDFYW
jgi:7-dehydrocholesterol reductase